MNRKRASTTNDLEVKARTRVTAVDFLNAYGGVEDEADEDRSRAVSVDFIREQAAKQRKKRSNSLDLVVEEVSKTFFASIPSHKDSKGSDIRTSSVDILNAFGGIDEGDESQDS
jgi:hypothetical protein